MTKGKNLDILTNEINLSDQIRKGVPNQGYPKNQSNWTAVISIPVTGVSPILSDVEKGAGL